MSVVVLRWTNPHAGDRNPNCNRGSSAWESVQSRPSTWPDLRNGLSMSDRESPGFTRVNGPLMARRLDHVEGRPSAFQAGHIPSWHRSCESYALSPVAAACRWLLLLLSPLLSARPGRLCPAAPWSSAGDRPYHGGDGPVPWPGSLPGPWFLARVLPEARCQGWPKAISGGNQRKKRLSSVAGEVSGAVVNGL